MDQKRRRMIFAVVAAVLVGGIGYVAWLGIPHLTGSNHDVPKEAESQALHMARWVFVAAERGEPRKLFNAMAPSYREVFAKAFDDVRKAAEPYPDWLRAASDAGVAGDAAGLRSLDDLDMFLAWWHLDDRNAIGFRLPAIFRRPFAAGEEVVMVKVFWETEPLKSNECHVLYSIGEVKDLIRFVRLDGVWRMDELKEVPAGM